MNRMNGMTTRYYSGWQGRFSSPDIPLIDQHTEEPKSWNLYSYVRNNPLIYTDPTGNDCVYLNSDQTGIADIDTLNTSKKCSNSEGYWADGTVTGVRFDHGAVNLTGTTNGKNRTSASYVLGSAPGDLSLYGQLFYNEMSRRRDASNQFITTFLASSSAVGTTCGTLTYLSGTTAGSD